MAKRVPVVVSQSQFSDASRRNVEEELVAMLLLEDNVEVTVIPHLSTLEEGSTGLLCLEGLGTDLILCAWETAETTIQHLLDLKQPAMQGRTTFCKDATLAGDKGRRLVYAIDLSQQGSIDVLRQEILRIRDEAQTQVFNILGTSLPIAAPQPVESPPRDQSTGQDQDTESVADQVKRAPDDSNSTANTGNAANAMAAAEDDSEDEIDRELDQLLDDFDAMDI